MNLRISSFILAFTLAAGSLLAAEPQWTDRFSDRNVTTLSINDGATLWIESAHGSIVITGGEKDRVVFEAVRTVKATDPVALSAAREALQVSVSGDASRRVLRSVGITSTPRAVSSVDYTVRVPNSTNINVITRMSEKIRVSGVSGRVVVRNISGVVEVDRVTGAIQVDTANGRIMVRYPVYPVAGSRFSTINGDIEIRLPQQAKFTWVADTVKGDILAGFPLESGASAERGVQRLFRTDVNGAGGPVLQTSTMSGKTYLLPIENSRALAHSVLPERNSPLHDDLGAIYKQVLSWLVQPPSTNTFLVRKERVGSDFDFETGVGNIFIGQVDGNASLIAKAGEIVVGRVTGGFRLESMGGSVNLGYVSGALSARTAAGDVMVRHARSGGTLVTGGGTVNVIHSDGPITVESGGGDISIGRATSRVAVATKSGDIDLGVSGDASVDARTGRGSITLALPAGAGVTVDATLLVAAEDAGGIHSQLPGLTILREREGSRIRVRARGDINGGGARITLHAENGSIDIRRAR